ncbi:hypothetical protein J6590_030533 [Homalodisca vitripennis]|nr:hypothetical protein J6590_030533 [Homalodisca vitripennis]
MYVIASTDGRKFRKSTGFSYSAYVLCLITQTNVSSAATTGSALEFAQFDASRMHAISLTGAILI